MNKFIGTGVVQQGVELKINDKGTKYARFRFKLIDNYELYLDVTAFNKLADDIDTYVKRKDTILVEGKLNLNSFTDKEGRKQYRYGITLENYSILSEGSNTYEVTSNEDNTVTQNEEETLEGFNYNSDDLPF